jgi:hypothetical protein
MSAALFDPDAIVREVRAAANLPPPATTATLRQTSASCRNVATVARTDALADRAECRSIAIVATPRASDDADEAAIEERAGICADSVPTVYLDAWARLNHQRPFGMSEAEWRRALDDGGRFLDAWGNEAVSLGWTPERLFDTPGGLFWRIAGRRVSAIGDDYVRFRGGRGLQWI